MATPVLIPVSEYLRTTYRPDRDFVDGQLKERDVGETPHSTLQSWLAGIFLLNRGIWGLRALTEQRVQVSPDNFRIPDVCAMPLTSRLGRIVTVPPLICIEILSEGQSLNDMRDRVADYVRMGVEHVWLFDPIRRKAWTADATGFHDVADGEFSVLGTPVRIPLSDINLELDDLDADL